MENYRLEEPKGDGAFSEVFMAENVETNKYYAVKCMKKKYETVEKVQKLK